LVNNKLEKIWKEGVETYDEITAHSFPVSEIGMSEGASDKTWASAARNSVILPPESLEIRKRLLTLYPTKPRQQAESILQTDGLFFFWRYITN
jgi:hypothetical protein